MRDNQSTAKSENTADPAIIAGNTFTLKVERNRASRVAFPATCCAIIAADAIAATIAPGGRRPIREAMWVRLNALSRNSRAGAENRAKTATLEAARVRILRNQAAR
jgi:hypothetical protein